MPSKFTGTLQRDQPTDYQPTIRHDDTLATVAEAAKDVGAAAFQKIDKGIIKSVIDTSTGVLSEVAAYEQRKRELLLASSTADQQHLDQYSQELVKLRSGELQGRISPAMATAKNSILAKEYSKRFPHLESQIRAITDQTISGIRAISAESDKLDPDVKAAYDTIEKAHAAGQTPEDYMHDQAAARMFEHSQKRVQQAEVLGQGLETAVRANVHDFTTVAINEAIGSIVASAKAGRVIKEDELAQLARLQGNLTSQINAQLIQQELNTGAKFSQGFRDALTKEINDRLATVTAMASNMDTPERQKKFLDWAVTQSKQKFIDAFGDLGALAIAGNNPVEVYKNVLGTQAQIEKGLRPTLETIATSDPATAYFLKAIDTGQFKGWAMGNVDAAGKGQPTSSSGNRTMDKAGQGFSLRIIEDPSIPMDTRVNHEISLVESQGMFSDGLETALEHRGSLPFIQSNPKVQTAVKNGVSQRLASAMERLTPDTAGHIVYNSVKKQFEVDPNYLQELRQSFQTTTKERVGQNPRLMPEGFTTNPTPTVPAPVLRTLNAANLGLKAYSLMNGDVPGFVKNVFELINKTVNPVGDQAQNDSQKPKVELTPEQMDQADADFNAVLKDLKARKLTGAQATLEMKKIAAKYNLD